MAPKSWESYHGPNAKGAVIAELCRREGAYGQPSAMPQVVHFLAPATTHISTITY